jgi:RTX calcium-binding nonapeptide repeat (4 copies)
VIALLIVVILLAAPATAGAVTVSVEPYAEPPGTDPFGSCSRYMMCPPDMIVVAAAPNEANAVVVSADGTVPGGTTTRYRFIVRDRIAQMQAGPGCTQVDFQTVACAAGAVGPVRLDDGDDSFASSLGAGEVHGGGGQDVLRDADGPMRGGEGDDVIVGGVGYGGGGDDVLMVHTGHGGPGDDVVRCFPRDAPCTLRGGPGGDLLTGGTSLDRIFAGRGADRVDCGPGRRDRAVTDRRDAVRRCERAG